MNNAEYLSSRRLGRIMNGLCRDCGNPVVGDFGMCEYHRQKHKEEKVRWRAKYPDYFILRREKFKSKGRCSHCGLPLEDGESGTCVNCTMAMHPGG